MVKAHTLRKKLRKRRNCRGSINNKTRKLRGGNNPIILYQGGGGLGDNLQYTTLPELYSKQGHKVYISSKNAYRSDEMYDLIWKTNPYVEGVSDLPANAGSVMDPTPYAGTVSFIKSIELAHGLHNGYRKYPVIYYKPTKIKGIEKYLFYDPTFISDNGGSTSLNYNKSFTSIFNKYPTMTPYMIRFKKGYGKGVDKIKKNSVNSMQTAVYEIENMKHYCDLLYSCKVFVCGFSGGSVLASAIKQDNRTPEVYSFYSTAPHNQYLFKFENIHYLPVI